MSTIPTKREDFKKFAGQMIDVDSKLFDTLPADTVIVVGGEVWKRQSDVEEQCKACRSQVWLDARDLPELRKMKAFVVVCPSCYLKSEPKEAK